jgi:uncharacterized protein (UPF0303 family)
MGIESDIEIIKQQEQRLRFAKFDEQDAWTLGSLMRERALARNLPLVLDLRLGMKPLFYFAMPGTTPENPDWIRRKVNTVYRFEASTYRIALEHKFANKPFDQSRGIVPENYAAAGGGFPIHIKGTGIVGAATVSGIPQREDHGFVAGCLAEFLNVAYRDIQLPADDTE